MTTLAEYNKRLDSMFAPARKSIFIYPGAKSSHVAKQSLTRAFPRSFQEYREPFVGGGSIAMMMPLRIPRWINDINAGLMAVYGAMQDRPTAFINELRALVSTSIVANRITFNRLLWDDNSADLAVRYLFLNRFSYNGMVRFDQERRYRTTFSEERGHHFFRTGRLEAAIPVIRGMQISCGDYGRLLEAPGHDVFIYIDAPYVVDTRTTWTAKLYQHSFHELSDHYRLLDCATRSPHKIMLSYDDQPLIRSLYGAWNIRETLVRYQGTANKRYGRELIITNYDQ